MTASISDLCWQSLSDAVAAQMGLHFAKERWPDLKRAIESASEELGFKDAREAVDAFLANPFARETVDVLAKHLTIGETYFFRDPTLFEVLEQKIFPALIQSRRTDRRLRIWSAGCCSGEEPYSVAILLSKLLPDIDDWEITILATDISSHFLRKATAATYTKWSFRGKSHSRKESYFTRTDSGRFKLLPKYQKLVSFAFSNLVQDDYPSRLNNTDEMDVILCRNVLMYFLPAQAEKVITKLRQSLAPGGWLISSAAEAGPRFNSLTSVSFPGCTLYRKDVDQPKDKPAAPLILLTSTPEPVPNTNGKKHVAKTVSAKLDVDLGYLAKVKADQGNYREALAMVEEALRRDRSNLGLHYLKGSILQEQNDLDNAVRSFQRVLHLDEDFVMAYFSLGTIMRKIGRTAEQAKYFKTALCILKNIPGESVVAESSGMSAKALSQIIEAAAG